MKHPKHTNAVIVRLEPSQAEYDAVAHRYGMKKASRNDVRAWAEGTLRASMEQLLSEVYDHFKRHEDKA